MIEFHAAIFHWFPFSFGAPSCFVFISFGPAAYHLESGGIPLHDTIGVNYINGATTNVKAQVQVYGRRVFWIIVRA